ncbi:MAG TPA: acyltransferase [Roseiarcus sp.]|nr:acyltransferase [Roseiarcus sp.]
MKGSVQTDETNEASPGKDRSAAARRAAAGQEIGDAARGATSLALNNLRGVVILVVVAFHSALAYLGSSPSSPFPFDKPPYQWRAFAIIDSHRWFGFDLFCAWQDVYLMALMFFLSALFTWPSLTRKGASKFLSDRLLRLGAPYVFGLAVVMPAALYPVYSVAATDQSVAAYARHFLALPFWPNGPMWFLWQLLALTVLAAALRVFWPDAIARLGRFLSTAGPRRCFLALAGAAALAYVPLALAFTPWRWADQGPLALQYCRPLLYAVYYCAGLAVGAFGLEQGPLASRGALPHDWRLWLAATATALIAWMGLTALTMKDGDSAPVLLQIAADASFATAGAASLFFVMAASLRFGAACWPVLDSLANNAMGIYLLHYAPVVWLQYALLPTDLPAFAKASIVFVVALLASWAATALLRAVPYACRLIGEEPRPWRLRGAVRHSIARRG